jgi:hypothetical protein
MLLTLLLPVLLPTASTEKATNGPYQSSTATVPSGPTTVPAGRVLILPSE